MATTLIRVMPQTKLLCWTLSHAISRSSGRGHVFTRAVGAAHRSIGTTHPRRSAIERSARRPRSATRHAGLRRLELVGRVPRARSEENEGDRELGHWDAP